MKERDKSELFNRNTRQPCSVCSFFFAKERSTCGASDDVQLNSYDGEKEREREGEKARAQE